MKDQRRRGLIWVEVEEFVACHQLALSAENHAFRMAEEKQEGPRKTLLTGNGDEASDFCAASADAASQDRKISCTLGNTETRK